MSYIRQFIMSKKNNNNSTKATADNDNAISKNFFKNTINCKKKQQKILKLEKSTSVPELNTTEAEIALLKKQLEESQKTIENLQELLKLAEDKQNNLLCRVYDLRKRNKMLHEECRSQRDYQTVERNVLMRELYDVRTKLYERTDVVDKILLENSVLTKALQSANEKICVMGLKYLKLRSFSKTLSENSYEAASKHSSEYSD